MDASAQVLRVPSLLSAEQNSSSPDKLNGAAPCDYILREDVALPSLKTVSRGSWTMVALKLNGIASKHALFYQNLASCVLASCNGNAAHVKSAWMSSHAKASRSPSDVNASGALSAQTKGRANVGPATELSPSTCAAPSVPPDLESFWLATSPMPPTAAFAALFSLLPLRQASVVDDAVNRSAANEALLHHQSLPLGHIEWTLCRSWESRDSKGGWRVSFWEAFAMTAVAAHSAAGTQSSDSAWGSPATPSLSTSGYSMEQQLRRAATTLRQGSAAATASAAAGLLEWPEELLWNLLISLLSVTALVHSAGLHFYGQLAAADILCLSCASMLPRVLEQTWEGVLAAASAQEAKTAADAVEGVTLFRRFYATAASSVLLPQAALTADTPCHNAFFVVQPTFSLLGRHQQLEPSGFVAQEGAEETPKQLARFQAADLASVGRLLTSILELRAQWAAEGNRRVVAREAAAVLAARNQPSSELTFLVRRLCECESTTDSATASSSAPRGCPTALQLLQLQALRLRTETWYYRRLSAEAYDELAHLQPEQRIRETANDVAGLRRTLDHRSNSSARRREKEKELQAREAAVAEREQKLDLILRVYELTHEHLDAVPLTPSESPSAVNDAKENGGRARRAATPPRSSTPRDDSLEALLAAPSYRQAAATTAAPMVETRRAPLTNISHRQLPMHGGSAAGAAVAEISGDGLMGLSPLPRASPAEDADTTLLSASATPFAAFRDAHNDAQNAEAVSNVDPAEAMQALSWSAPQTRRTLDVAGAVAPVATGSSKLGANVRTLLNLPQTWETPVLPHTTPTATNFNVPEPAFHVPVGVPWEKAVVHAEQLLYAPSGGELRKLQVDGSSLPTPQQVTVVEVELDDSGEEEAWQADKRSPDTKQEWLGPGRAVRDVQLVASPHLQPPPPPLPAARVAASPPSSKPISSIAQELQTPVRAPTLPNMGTSEADAAGGGSHSKYSSLPHLRSPPSARRPAAGGAKANASPSPSPHSPDSYRSSTKPYTTAAASPAYDSASAAVAHYAVATAAERPPPSRSSRRRSGSRGSSGGHPDGHTGNTVAARGGGEAATANAVSAGGASENGEWARQQLHELQSMQSALRAQQPATPRSRASAAAVTGLAEMRTPELRRTQSPASTPPMRSSREAASTPRSSSLQATPPRGSVGAHCSPLGAEGGPSVSWANPSVALHADERPAQVQGVSWSPGTTAAAPLSGRQHHVDAWAAPVARTTPKTMHYALSPPSGRTSPPTKPAGAVSRLLSSSPGSGMAGHARPDPRVSSARSAGTRGGERATTAATAAALAAALRTPPRQTLPPAAAQGSARGKDAAEVAAQRTPLGHRLPMQGMRGAAAVSPGGTSRSAAASATPKGPTESKGEPLGSARLRGAVGGSALRPVKDSGAPRRREGAEVSSSISALPAGQSPVATSSAAGSKVTHSLRSGSSSLSAMELLKRLRASSTAAA